MCGRLPWAIYKVQACETVDKDTIINYFSVINFSTMQIPLNIKQFVIECLSNPTIRSAEALEKKTLDFNARFVYKQSKQCYTSFLYALCFQEILANSTLEELLMGMASQVAEREDNLLGTDIRNNLFGPMEFSRRDLGALNIMRGRDNGLPDYNSARSYLKLSRRKTWNEINPDFFEKNPDLLSDLIEIHDNNLNNVDVYVGGMLESTSGPGELFSTVIREQFLRLRDSDRFWFENDNNG